MDEGRKRVLAIVAGILGQHLKTTGDLWSTSARLKVGRRCHHQFHHHGERTSVAGVEKQSKQDVRTALIVRLAERLNDWLMPRSSAVWLHGVLKLVPNMWPRGDGTQQPARNGTHRRNQLGLQAKRSRNKSSHCSRASQHLRFDHELESRVGMQAKSGAATALIHGTGWRWRNSLASPRMSDTRPDAGGKVHRCERWRLPQNLTLACTWQSITVQNGPIQAGWPGVASQLPRLGCTIPPVADIGGFRCRTFGEVNLEKAFVGFALRCLSSSSDRAEYDLLPDSQANQCRRSRTDSL
jgi:hypothetical protein